MLVEDEYLVALEMARRFTGFGEIVVGPLATAQEAMTVAANGKLDGAVIDINLREDMAYDIADQLRKEHVPYVFATGYDRASIPPRFADVVHREKPVNPSRAAQALDEIF